MVENLYIGNNPKGATELIKKFNADLDSNSGIVTVPKVIGAGESVTIPTGRVAVLPNVQVDGTLNIEGEVFIPTGATFGDLESQIAERQLKSELAYNVDTSSYIPNTLTSGAIIERGSNSNGEYVKYADGTLICTKEVLLGNIAITAAEGSGFRSSTNYILGNFAHSFVSKPKVSVLPETENPFSVVIPAPIDVVTSTIFVRMGLRSFVSIPSITITLSCISIGRWK